MAVQGIAVVTVNEGEPAALSRYLLAKSELLEQVGGRIVRHFNLTQVQFGRQPLKSVIILEYPDHAAVARLQESDAYRFVVLFRDRAFLEYQMSITAG